MQIYLVRIFLHPVIFTIVDFAPIILLHSLLSHTKWNTEIIFGSIQVYFIFCNICNKKKNRYAFSQNENTLSASDNYRYIWLIEL